MASIEAGSFNALVEVFLGRRLPSALADPVTLPALSPEARGVIVRMLALMKRACVPATEFNSHMIHLLSTITPAMLPSAWGGRIPPVTASGRHRKLDAYASRQQWPTGNGKPVFIDLGCGFPPMTTVDTGRQLSQWSVLGVDRSFAGYVLYDADGHYACFQRDGTFQYFQSPGKPLHENPKTVRDRFEALFADLRPQLKAPDERISETVKRDGHRLVHNPIRDFEAHNLKFIEADLEDLQTPPARVIRCMNVLLYFEKGIRDRMRGSAARRLADGGILICGFNHPFGIYARYAVYGKDANGSQPREFAFSPDNLRPLGVAPWLTIQEQDEEAELLADLTGAIRADGIFWPEFDRRVDALQEQHGICRRGEDGFPHFTGQVQTSAPQVLLQKKTALWHQLNAEGYTDGAVQALCRAGHRAWKNAVGDIAVSPPEGSLPML